MVEISLASEDIDMCLDNMQTNFATCVDV
jgi:hypothetical protein